MSETRSDRRNTKEQKVLELCNQGYPYRKIASLVHLSLRDVTKFVNLASNKIKSPSVTSIHDEIILEYRVNLLRCEVKELELQRKNLKDETNNLRAQKYNVQIQLRAKQSELDVMKRNLEYEKFSKEILNDIFAEGQ
jgi:aspartyl-tRNA synthetase